MQEVATIPYEGRLVTRQEAAAAIALLEDPIQAELFYAIRETPDIEGFLHGSWSASFGAIANSRLWKHSVLCPPFKSYMQPALAASLVQALQMRQKRRIVEIATLVENIPALDAAACYEQTHTWIGAQIDLINALQLDKTADYVQRTRAVRKDLLDGKAYEARMLNCLPESLFRSRLGAFGLALAHLARRTFSTEPDFAIKAFSTARLLKVDGSVHHEIMGIYTHTVGKWAPVQEEDDHDPPLPLPRPKAKPKPPPPPKRPPPPPPKPKPPSPASQHTYNTPPKRDDWENYGFCSTVFFCLLGVVTFLFLLLKISN